MAEACVLCNATIQGKHYRALATKANVEKYGALLQTMGMCSQGKACYICVNKLNKIVNLKGDILAKQQKCQSDVDAIFSQLQKLPGVVNSVAPVTPINIQKGIKRQRTPQTPKLTPKTKRPLFTTPPKLEIYSKREVRVPTTIPTTSQGTQTTSCAEEFDVKIIVTYNGQQRSRILTEESEKNIVKCLLNRSGASALVKNLNKPKYKNEIVKSVVKDISKEVAEIVKNRSDVFKLCNIKDMLTFTQEKATEKIQQKLPTLYQLLNSIIPNKKKESMYLLTAMAILIYGRSQRLNLMQFIIGLVLQKCGLSKQGIEILHDLGLSVSYSSLQKKRKILISEQENKIKDIVTSFKHARTANRKPIEVLGDNVDITVSPAKMTLDKQRKSLHWFLLMVKQRRVTYEDVHATDQVLQKPIEGAITADWIPSDVLVKGLESDFKHHISNILLKYIDFVKTNIQNYPEYLKHKYTHLTEKKSVVLNCDLIEESENSSQGMIKILQKVHELAVPHIERKVVEKVVFGGDVLTNERAFSAQEAMQNNNSDFENLLGIIHRPEGLHREMNFLMGIYQLYYKEASSMDRGSLYQLRNLVNRRDVSGGPKDVISKFRPHHEFIEDVCDAYVVATFLDIFGMESEDSTPTSMPVFSLMNDQQKELWLNVAAEKVVDSLGLHFSGYDELREDLEAYNYDDVQIEAMKQNEFYVCALCPKQYRSVVWFRKHLSKKHQWKFHDTEHEDLTAGNAVRTFLLMALLYRDTCDAFKTSDGDRLVRNAYFEWLYAASIKHTKYKIWLWRLITYVKNVLSPEQSFEYKWNMTVNLQGGVKGNIPNDNCVEIQVANIKKLIEGQGANKSFEAARQACMITQVLDSIQVQLMKSTKTVKPGRSRPPVDKARDIKCMVKCLRDQGQLKDFQWGSFSTFIDPLKCISAADLHSWINGQRKIANVLM